METFTRKYDDGREVVSCLDPDRLDTLYAKLRDIHKKEFPDWSIHQLLTHLRHWYPELAYEWVEMSDEGLVAKLEEYAAYWHAKFKPKTISEEDTCTENH